ncbi:unnamed protein product [Allacma fusca]|uniref:Uncharacterized protein n=1 Tax=Allacma fusca TaxID=39272 RepID=A0A8J2KBJ4_9HEXA|nr:unnamed protein product [Allacma fusca]
MASHFFNAQFIAKIILLVLLLIIQESHSYREDRTERTEKIERTERVGQRDRERGRDHEREHDRDHDRDREHERELERERERDRDRNQDSDAQASIHTYETIVPAPERFLHNMKSSSGLHDDDYTPRPKHTSSFSRGNTISENSYSTIATLYPPHRKNPMKEEIDTEETMSDMKPPQLPKMLLPRVTLRHDGPIMFGAPSQECRKCGGFTLGVAGTCCQACGKLGYNKGCWCRQCDCLCYDT